MLLYHGTSPESAEAILARGFDAEAMRKHDVGDWGWGVYLTDSLPRARSYGTVLEVDVDESDFAHIKSPYFSTLDPQTPAEQLLFDLAFDDRGEMLTVRGPDRRGVAREIRDTFLREGYSGIYPGVTDAMGTKDVVVFDPAAIRSVRRMEPLKANPTNYRTVGEVAERDSFRLYDAERLEPGQSLSVGDLQGISDASVDTFVAGPAPAYPGGPDREPDDLDLPEGFLLVVPSGATGGDYAGSVYNKANYLAIAKDFEDHPDVHPLYGGYGSFGIAIRAGSTDENLIEMVAGLQDYPVYDDDALSEYEMALQEEAWEGWAAAEYKESLLAAYESVEGWEEALDALEEAGALSWAFHDVADAEGIYWEAEGQSMTIDVEKVADATAPGVLLDSGSWSPGFVGASLTRATAELGAFLRERVPQYTAAIPETYDEASSQKLHAIINGLWDEGIQAPFALGAPDEWALLDQLKKANVKPALVIALSDVLGGVTTAALEAEKRYRELANRFLVLDTAYRFAAGSVARSSPEWREDAEEVVAIYKPVLEAKERVAADQEALGPWLTQNPRRRRAAQR